MRKYLLSYVFNVRSWVLSGILFFLAISFTPTFYAQQMSTAPTAAPAPVLTSKSDNTSAIDAPSELSMDSFADVAALGQEIALAQRKIQAMTLKNSLDALQAQQDGTTSLRVLRVEGFGNNLYAVLADDSGAIYHAAPGDMINKQYRVSSLRPYSVGIVDIATQKFYLVPFQVEGAGIDIANTSADTSDNSAQTLTAASTAPASS